MNPKFQLLFIIRPTGPQMGDQDLYLVRDTFPETADELIRDVTKAVNESFEIFHNQTTPAVQRISFRNIEVLENMSITFQISFNGGRGYRSYQVLQTFAYRGIQR